VVRIYQVEKVLCTFSCINSIANHHRVEMYYTYAYLREDKTPYYIGKGKGNRIFNKNKGDIRPPKDKSRIIFLKKNLTEAEAFRHEIYMITVFGRKDLETGILRNRTDGGEGASGLVMSEETRKTLSELKVGEKNPNYGKEMSEEQKQKISEKRKGTKLSEEHKDKIRQKMMGNTWNVGKKLSDETKRKVGEAQKGNQYMKGMKFSEETKQKMSEAHKGKTPTEETRKKLSEAKKGNQNWKYRKHKNDE
jgi:hypothetical protein